MTRDPFPGFGSGLAGPKVPPGTWTWAWVRGGDGKIYNFDQTSFRVAESFEDHWGWGEVNGPFTEEEYRRNLL
jgi:hypothetical protein